jgi:outer membrane lipoprotein-sorting protein
MLRSPIVLTLTCVVAVILLLGGVALLLASGGGSTREQLTSYYFEAHVEVVQDEAAFGDQEPLDTVRGWYESPGMWRWEFSDSDPARSEEGSVQVSDGQTVWYYDRPTNTYFRQSLAGYNEGKPPELTDGPPLLAAGFLIGWLPYGDKDRFFQPWGEREERDGGQVAGLETRQVIVTLGDTTTTFWLDRELPFILKFEAKAPGTPQSLVRAEITEVSLNKGVEGQPFSFEPPKDAREVDAPGRQVSSSSGSSSIGGSTIDVPEGFLSPAYVPTGYATVSSQGTSSSTLGGQQTQFSVRLEMEGVEGYLQLDEQYRAGGLADSQRTGQPLSIGNAEAYDQSTGAIVRLVWAQGDIVVTVMSDVLPMSELLRLAESMR